METILIAIADNGDGSSSLEWFCNVDEKTLEEFLEKDEYDSYASGDGIQIKKLNVSDLTDFLNNNPQIYVNDFRQLIKNEDLMGDPDEYDYD